MTNLRQAAQQALEALETLMLERGSIYETAITSLREALAKEHAMHELSRLGQEIEQEPTPWREMVVVTLVREGINKHRARELADHFATQPEQEPVAWVCFGAPEKRDIDFEEADINGLPIGTLLYTAPPAAQRKPLTDEAIWQIAKNYALTNPTTPLHFARAIEAAHNIKEGT
jgi:hypothetical protein